MRFRLERVLLASIACAAVGLALPGPARGQPSDTQVWTDAQMPRAGEISVGFGIGFERADGRFRPDGSTQPFTRVYSALIDASLEPALDPVQSTVQALFQTLGLEAPGALTLGRIRYDVLAEHTRLPLTISFAPTDFLAVVGTVPFVQGKAFVTPTLDQPDVGPSATAFGDDPNGFFTALDERIATLQSAIDEGTLTGDELARAQELVADARTLRDGLAGFRELPYAPTDSGTAGRALHDFYSGLDAGFGTFELELPELVLADPADPASLGDLAAGPEFGIERPVDRDSGIRLGDIELGLRLQPFDSFRRREEPDAPAPLLRLRTTLDALWRFPTGTAPAPNRVLDPGTGDGQADLEFRSAIDLAIGDRFWTSLLGRLNLQRAAEQQRLFTSPESPIQRGAFVATVNRDPGDEWSVAIVPRFNFTPAITFSGFLSYAERADDRITPLSGVPSAPAFTAGDVERGTGYRATTAGLAVRYASTYWTGDRRAGLPVEVALLYRRRVDATGGFTPELSRWQVVFRWYGGLLD